MNAAQILLVEDDPILREDVKSLLVGDGHQVLEAGDGITALAELEQHNVDLMLLDLDLPRLNGMKVLEKARVSYPHLPIIIVTGQGSIPIAVEAIQLGAYDFLEKPFNGQRTQVAVRNALEKVTLERERAYLLDEARKRYQMIGTSAVMQSVYRLIDKAALAPSKVLILGESGSGKELVARAIHTNSTRAGKPFVALNCAAIPESLIESELFGYEKGAFTSAHTARDGRFVQADKGTLFLDEIGDMSLMTQAKTLRALEDSIITRIGGKEERKVNVRVLAATNKDLQEEIKAGGFREDLYYRLGVITIHVPPLRSRREDIPLLVKHFIRLFAREHTYPEKHLTAHAMQVLQDHDWPGNVRQLRNSVERLVVLSEDDSIGQYETMALLQHGSAEPMADTEPDLRQARDNFEKTFILNMLESCEWKMQETADKLGIDRTSLWKKMQKHSLKPPTDKQ